MFGQSPSPTYLRLAPDSVQAESPSPKAAPPAQAQAPTQPQGDPAVASRPPTMRVVPTAREAAAARAELPREPINPPPIHTGKLQPLTGVDEVPALPAVATSREWVRFGVIDNSVIVVSALAGISLDKAIAQRVGTKGYGPLVGALVGNAIGDTIAALSQGVRPAASVFAGAMLPVIPVAAAIYLKKPLKGSTAVAVGTATALLLAFAYRKRIMAAMT